MCSCPACQWPLRPRCRREPRLQRRSFRPYQYRPARPHPAALRGGAFPSVLLPSSPAKPDQPVIAKAGSYESTTPPSNLLARRQRNRKVRSCASVGPVLRAPRVCTLASSLTALQPFAHPSVCRDEAVCNTTPKPAQLRPLPQLPPLRDFLTQRPFAPFRKDPVVARRYKQYPLCPSPCCPR